MTDASEIDYKAETLGALSRILAQVQAIGPDSPRCPDLQPGQHCDRVGHYDRDPTDRGLPPVLYLGRCPALQRADTLDLLSQERDRLAGALEGCAGGFQAYDQTRLGALSERAYGYALRFSLGRPPRRSLLLCGDLGVGKTHLALASHFALLSAAVRSCFVSSTDLRELFRACMSFDDDTKREAETQRGRLLRADVIHWDDVGDVEGDQRRRGEFCEGVKFLLDRGRAWWFLTSNLDAIGVANHPDVGRKVLDRLLRDGPDGPAQQVEIKGQSQRRAHRKRSK
jgi:DNA replication protein DnaC